MSHPKIIKEHWLIIFKYSGSYRYYTDIVIDIENCKRNIDNYEKLYIIKMDKILDLCDVLI